MINFKKWKMNTINRQQMTISDVHKFNIISDLILQLPIFFVSVETLKKNISHRNKSFLLLGFSLC